MEDSSGSEIDEYAEGEAGESLSGLASASEKRRMPVSGRILSSDLAASAFPDHHLH